MDAKLTDKVGNKGLACLGMPHEGDALVGYKMEEEIVDYEYYRRGNEGHQRELLKVLFHIFLPFLSLKTVNCIFDIPKKTCNSQIQVSPLQKCKAYEHCF